MVGPLRHSPGATYVALGAHCMPSVLGRHGRALGHLAKDVIEVVLEVCIERIIKSQPHFE